MRTNLPTLPREYVSRPATTADLELTLGIVAACEQEDLGRVEIDAEDIAADWRRPGVDLARDSVLVFDPAGEPAANAEVFAGRAEGNVLRRHQGLGIGTALAKFIERRAREQGSTFVRQAVPASSATPRQLLEAAGYAHSDSGWVLSMPLDVTAAGPARMPAGVLLREFRAGHDETAVWRVMEDAFADWPNREPSTPDGWAEQTVRRSGFEPWMLPVLERAGEVVGAAYCIDYPIEQRGWVHQLAVRADCRGLGLGTALLQVAFARFAGRGRTEVGLSTDSRTGALDLYLRVGMRVTEEFAGHTLAL